MIPDDLGGALTWGELLALTSAALYAAGVWIVLTWSARSTEEDSA